MPTIYLSKNDLLRVNFTYSPIQELCWSYYLLTNANLQRMMRHAKLDTWIAEANSQLEGYDFPYMDALMPRYELADFLFPTTHTNHPKIKEELRLLRATPAHVVCHEVSYFIERYGSTPARRHYMTNPAAALGHLVDEMMFYWERVLARHWSRILTVLRGDVFRRAQNMVTHGAGTVFDNLHRVTSFLEGDTALDIGCWCPRESTGHLQIDFDFEPKGRGLIFKPTVFHTGVNWGLWYGDQPTIFYGAWGAGLWQPHVPVDPNEELASALGDSKARLLHALVIPASTSEIARLLGLTAGSVSAQLQNLGTAGLVNSSRSGHRVIYRLSERGEQLLTIFG